jgi:hypothetical protein
MNADEREWEYPNAASIALLAYMASATEMKLTADDADMRGSLSPGSRLASARIYLANGSNWRDRRPEIRVPLRLIPSPTC